MGTFSQYPYPHAKERYCEVARFVGVTGKNDDEVFENFIKAIAELKEKYVEKYGEYFFNDTYPVLIVHNKTLNYSQEIEINDFANSWYIHLPDSRSEYYVELCRRFKEYAKRNPEMPHKEEINSVIPVSSSNDLIMPNDHVLLEEIKPQVKYRNVKTNEETFKNTTRILANNKLIDFYNLYKELYQVENLSSFFTLSNPSSGNPTSTFK